MTILFPVIIYAQAGINLTGMGVELNSYGRLRVYKDDLNGKVYIDHISILAGTTVGSVFDYYQDSGNIDTLRYTSPDLQSDTGIYVAVNNSYSNLPPSVTVKENVYIWNSSPFFLVRYTVFNSETFPLNLTTGLEIVPKIGGYYGSDSIRYNPDEKYFKIYKGSFQTGFKYFSPDSSQITSLAAFNWYPFYQNDTLFYNLLTKNIPDTTWFSNEIGAIVVSGHQTKTLNPNDSLWFFYAFTIGENDSVLSANLSAAQVKYNRIVTNANNELSEIPLGYSLNQNYPNPFNPSTTISFTLPKQQYVKLSVYNILGQKVNTLFDEIKSSGIYKVSFNASNLPSGVYIYRLEGEGISLSRKMLLIK